MNSYYKAISSRQDSRVVTARNSSALIKLGKVFLALLMVLISIGTPASSQANDGPHIPVAAMFAFEISVLKPSKPGNYSSWGLTEDSVILSNNTLYQMISYAYQIQTSDQFVGLPKWAYTQEFDLTAKADSETVASLRKLSPKDEKVQKSLMLQALLGERFQLKLHHEDREIRVFTMVCDKCISKLTVSTVVVGEGSSSAGRGQIVYKGTRLSNLAVSLSSEVGRLVVDQTGLNGLYDITLNWSDDMISSSAGDSGPSIFAALKEQLGLKLEPGKSMEDVLVTDHVGTNSRLNTVSALHIHSATSRRLKE